MITVRNMLSSSGNEVANQFEIFTEDARIFQSYKSTIAKVMKKSNKTYLDKNYWDYSVTTGRYRNEFLGESKRETEKKIKSGEYILTDLNQKEVT